MSSTPTSTIAHIGWADALRIVACFLVVLSHCCDPYIAAFDGSGNFVTAVGVGSLMRCCVPLFAMISGLLLFPVNMDMGAFYRKRLKRVVIPCIVWSLALPLLYYCYFAAGAVTTNPSIVNVVGMNTFTWDATVAKLFTFPFNFNYDTTPLWYVYMLIGLYLFMPIINPWLTQAKKKDLKIFLGIWIFTMILPYVQMFAPQLGYAGNYGNMGILGVCDWNPYGMFYNFAGFMGYMVLAYYLVKFPLTWSWGKTLAIIIPMFLVGYAITFLGYLETQNIYPGDYSKLEILWYFSGINVFLMTYAVFVLFSRLNIQTRPWMTKLAGLTFGIYLCHFFFLQCTYDFYHGVLGMINQPAGLVIPLMAVSAFIFTAFIVWLLSLCKITKRAIM